MTQTAHILEKAATSDAPRDLGDIIDRIKTDFDFSVAALKTPDLIDLLGS